MHKKVLIAIVTYNRLEMTKRTLEALFDTTDESLYDLYICDNASTDGTVEYLHGLQHPCLRDKLFNHDNRGTARGVNACWVHRLPEQHAVKMDNDIVINTKGWLERCLSVFDVDTNRHIGLVGLKRKDCIERPDHPEPWYRSVLFDLPNGERVEECHHIMGSCQLYRNSALHKIGYLSQPRLYGFDDALASVRLHVAGFHTVFLQGIDIDHIDPGGTPYQEWKEKVAGEDMASYHRFVQAYQNHQRDVFEGAEL